MTLPYELCKKLKDSGFPQKDHGNQFDYIDASGNRGNLDADESYYCPTLNELIEACGEEFTSLFRVNAERWEADHEQSETIHGGKTPSEAVAKLYLALNEHDSGH